MRAPALLLCGFLAAPQVWAQRLSGQGTCGPPAAHNEIPVGDRPDHTFSITKTPCSWTRPFEIAGQRAAGGMAVQSSERTGSRERFRGHYLDAMSGGDTVHYEFQGTATLKDQQPESVAWSWTIVNGTGKLKGVSGQGTCKGSWPGGSYKWTCTGGYKMGRS